MGCLHSAGNNYEEDDDGYNTLRINKNGLGKLKLLNHCRCVQIGFLFTSYHSFFGFQMLGSTFNQCFLFFKTHLLLLYSFKEFNHLYWAP